MLEDLKLSLENRSVAEGKGKTTSSKEVASESFGRVYSGSLFDFASGSRHYVMVSDLRNCPSRDLRLAPITSQRQRGKKMILILEPGTLPARREGGEFRNVTSYVILRWKTRYKREHVVNSMDFVCKLPDPKAAEGRLILSKGHG